MREGLNRYVCGHCGFAATKTQVLFNRFLREQHLKATTHNSKEKRV